MPSYLLKDSYQALRIDSFRQENPFTAEVAEATMSLLNANDDDNRASILADWLKKHQPCIFGRLAAERDLISYCFLTEHDLMASDEAVLKKIQTVRRAWKALAEHGKRSGFIIMALSQKLVDAAPDDNLKQFAIELATLYLKRQILPDRIYMDYVRLWDVSFTEQRRWGVGANVFAIQGDQRWWHDHRIVGGLAFSMNSVGHLVASEARRQAIQEAATRVLGTSASSRRRKQLKQLEANHAKLSQTSVQSLEHALRYAMHTIHSASFQNAGGRTWKRATSLLRVGPESGCPFPLIASDSVLKGMDCSTYMGWYHTDITIPGEYFLTQQARPETIKNPFVLDFSYLHARREPDFKMLAQGVAMKSQHKMHIGRTLGK